MGLAAGTGVLSPHPRFWEGRRVGVLTGPGVWIYREGLQTS